MPESRSRVPFLLSFGGDIGFFTALYFESLTMLISSWVSFVGRLRSVLRLAYEPKPTFFKAFSNMALLLVFNYELRFSIGV